MKALPQLISAMGKSNYVYQWDGFSIRTLSLETYQVDTPGPHFIDYVTFKRSIPRDVNFGYFGGYVRECHACMRKIRCVWQDNLLGRPMCQECYDASCETNYISKLDMCELKKSASGHRRFATSHDGILYVYSYRKYQIPMSSIYCVLIVIVLLCMCW